MTSNKEPLFKKWYRRKGNQFSSKGECYRVNGPALMRLRCEAGIQLRELAEALGKSVTSTFELERGRTFCNEATVNKITEFFQRKAQIK